MSYEHEPYWMIRISSPGPTPWHPTETEGPFAVLNRGSFKTRDEAARWAERELGESEGWTIVFVKDENEPEPVPNLNGARTWRRKGNRSDKLNLDNAAIFIELPRALWRSCGPCNCSHCKGKEGFWDTLVVKTTANDTAWTVHCPERK